MQILGGGGHTTNPLPVQTTLNASFRLKKDQFELMSFIRSEMEL